MMKRKQLRMSVSVLLVFILFVLALNFVSASHTGGNDYWGYSGSSWDSWFDGGRGGYGNYYKQTTEFKQTTTSESRDYWGSQKRTVTVSDKTTIEMREPRYYYDNRYGDSYYYAPRYDRRQDSYNRRY